MTNKLDQEGFDALFESIPNFDSSSITTVYVYMKAPIRSNVIRVVCEESSVKYVASKLDKENLATLRRTGEIFPAVILKLANKEHQSFDYHIVPVGGILPKRDIRIPLFLWRDLTHGLSGEDAAKTVYANKLRYDDIIHSNDWSPNVRTLIKRVVGRKTGKFIIGQEKKKRYTEDTASVADTISDSELSDHEADLEAIKTEPTDDLEKTIVPDHSFDDPQSLPASVTEETQGNQSAEPGDEGDDEDDDSSDNDSLNGEFVINSLSHGSKLKLPGFKETDNCEVWVNKCIFLIEMGGIIDKAKKVHHLCSHLTDPIQETVITELALLNKTDITVDEFTKALNKACKKNKFQYESLLADLKYNQDTHLNLRNFFYRIKQLVKQTVGNDSDTMVDKVSFMKFLEKLPAKVQQSEFLREYRKEKSDIMEIVDKCAELYDDFKCGQYSEANNIDSNDKEVKCHFCGIPGHIKDECRKLKAHMANNNGKNDIVCHTCGRRGHKSPECRSKPQGKKEYFDSRKSHVRQDITCHFCKKKGHKEADCFSKKRASQRDQNNS